MGILLLKVDKEKVPDLIWKTIGKINKQDSFIKVTHKGDIIIISNLDEALYPRSLDINVNHYLPFANVVYNEKVLGVSFTLILTGLMLQVLTRKNAILKHEIKSDNKIGEQLLSDTILFMQKQPNFMFRGAYYIVRIEDFDAIIISDYYLRFKNPEVVLKRLLRRKSVKKFFSERRDKGKYVHIKVLLTSGRRGIEIGRNFAELLYNTVFHMNQDDANTFLKMFFDALSNNGLPKSKLGKELFDRYSLLVQGGVVERSPDFKVLKIEVNKSNYKVHPLSNEDLLRVLIYTNMGLYNWWNIFKCPNNLEKFVKELYTNEEFLKMGVPFVSNTLNLPIHWYIKSKRFTPILMSGRTENGKWIGLFFPFKITKKTFGRLSDDNIVVGWVSIIADKPITEGGVHLTWFGNSFVIQTHTLYGGRIIYKNRSGGRVETPNCFPFNSAYFIINITVIPKVGLPKD